LKIYKAAKLKILGSHIIEPTIRIYREALSFVIDVCYKEKAGWLTLGGKDRYNFVEKLIHTTSDNPNPKYAEFDKKFYKMPSYLRRSIVAEAIGIVISYLSSQDRYTDKKTKALNEGKKFTDKPPRLSLNHYSFPVLYKNGMFDSFNFNGTCRIKLFIDNDWKYVNISFDKRALYSSKTFRFDGYTMDSPSLVFKSKRFYLNVPFYKNVELSKEQDIVIGVDLGITNSAVVSAVMKDGTVIDRLFINQPKEKDHLKYQLERLSEANSFSGCKNKKPNIWRKINNLIGAIATQTANDIVDFAKKKDWLVGLNLFAMSFVAVCGVYYFKPFIDNHFSMNGVSLGFQQLDWANWLDIFTTSLFLIGMWFMAKRKVENWLFWIVGDLICIPMMLYKGLGITSLQYLVFTIMAVMGYLEWLKQVKK